MASPVTDILWDINAQVAKFSHVSIPKITEVLDLAEKELTHDLARILSANGEAKFTAQMYRNALIQIRHTIDHIKGPFRASIGSALKYGGVHAANLATDHLIREVKSFSEIFEGTIRPIALEAAAVLASGEKAVWKRFDNSAKRYAGAVGEDIRRQLAIGVVKGETIDQLTNRLAKMGGPKGHVYTQGQAGSPHAKAEICSEGLFRKYRHYAERLARTEVVHAYNSFALDGMDELNKEDPGYFKRWDAALDSRTCPDCASFDDLVVALDATFRGQDQPPLHPNCRCAQVIWRKEWKEHSHKDDILGKVHEGKEPKGVASMPHVVKTKKRRED